ncbi:unnamed protein product, partial [marine sediment metagenome]
MGAIINKATIIQKLIDELNLSPGVDKIPTELADKILPTFQINQEKQKVEIEQPVATVVRAINKNSIAASTIIYTTPATGKFYLTNATLHYFVNEAVAAVGSMGIEITIGGVAQLLLPIEACLDTVDNRESLALNFQNPILIDAGTNIVLKCDIGIA